MEQTRKRKPSKKADEELEEIEAVVDAEAEAIKAATDDLLDEIDSLLEVEAETFVRNFVQKGGE